MLPKEVPSGQDATAVFTAPGLTQKAKEVGSGVTVGTSEIICAIIVASVGMGGKYSATIVATAGLSESRMLFRTSRSPHAATARTTTVYVATKSMRLRELGIAILSTSDIRTSG